MFVHTLSIHFFFDIIVVDAAVVVALCYYCFVLLLIFYYYGGMIIKLNWRERAIYVNDVRTLCCIYMLRCCANKRISHRIVASMYACIYVLDRFCGCISFYFVNCVFICVCVWVFSSIFRMGKYIALPVHDLYACELESSSVCVRVRAREYLMFMCVCVQWQKMKANKS